jgi:hypothetical protein
VMAWRERGLDLHGSPDELGQRKTAHEVDEGVFGDELA